MKIRIAIADDHKLVVAGLQYLFSHVEDMIVTGTYNNGVELLEGLKHTVPDVLLLDIQMPGTTGDELAEIVCSRYPGVKMVAVTNQDSAYYLRTMLKKGVSGYVLKTAPEDVLLHAIREVYIGNNVVDPALNNVITLDTASPRRHHGTTPVLTRREKEVFQYLTRNLTSQQIADELGISKKTVESHRLSLLMKLDVKNAAALIKKGIQLGLID